MDASNDAKTEWTFSSKTHTETNNHVGQNPYDDYYNMRNESRGKAIILNHKIFKFCSPRYGTEKDRNALIDILKELKFDVEIYNDLSVYDVLEVLQRVSRMDHSTSDCLVVAVMTHGTEGKLYARDSTYATNKLWTFFSAINCPSLAGKPKLFFIQACRGNKTDPGVNIRYETDSSSEQLYSIPVMADILIMYSTVEGYYAWRDPEKGSYFIQALVKQLRENYQKKDLLTILTFVNRQVAVEFTSEEPGSPEFSEKKEMCSIVSMLTRLLHFH